MTTTPAQVAGIWSPIMTTPGVSTLTRAAGACSTRNPMTRPTTEKEATDMAEDEENLDALRFRAGALALTIKELQIALAPMRDEIERRSPRRSSVSPEIPGTTIAVATIARKRDSRSITGWDTPEFIAWLNVQYPNEVELIERIRPATMKRFVLSDDGQVVGPTGELDIPGLVVHTSEGPLAITPNRQAAPALFDALRGVTVYELIRSTQGEVTDHD